MRVRQVDDRPSQVGVEGTGIPEVHQPPGELDEGILDEVLGELAIPRQQVGEAGRLSRMADVELAETAPRPIGHVRILPRCESAHTW
jgi:hypothetical protein